LVEFSYTISVIVVILVSLTVVITSVITGASLLDLIIRTSVTTLVIGGLLMLISWQISADALKVSLAEQKEEQEKEKEKEKAQSGESEEFKSDSALEAQ
jgi:type VI protein secretion system component VasK